MHEDVIFSKTSADRVALFSAEGLLFVNPRRILYFLMLRCRGQFLIGRVVDLIFSRLSDRRRNGNR